MIMYNPAFGEPSIRKFTIAGNNKDVIHLLGYFNKIEQGWGGKKTIVGTPRTGTNLKEETVLEIVGKIEPKKAAHILTVGISLLSNNSGKKDSTTDHNNGISELVRVIQSRDKGSEAINTDINRFVEYLKSLDLNAEMKLDAPNKSKTASINHFPQEITYIYKRYLEIKGKPVSPKETIYLMPTATNTAKHCAEVVKGYVNQNTSLNQYFDFGNIRPIGEGVTPELFGGTFDYNGFMIGISQLYESIYEIIKMESETRKIYINSTGGLSNPRVYMTLQALLHSHKCVICYVQETYSPIVRIPTYPVGVDFHHWHRNEARLKMVLNGNKAFKKYLSEEMKNLITGGKLNTLGNQFRDRYKEQRKKEPIEVYSKEIITNLLQDELGDEVKTYRDILENIIDKSGKYIWTGDKVPDMVEHASRHHHHLLEFAELFLTPMFDVNNSFLNIKERFCLIAGILLHDCGHSLDFIKMDNGAIIPLFPSEIRKYHHILSVQRLNDKTLGEDIGWDPKGTLSSDESAAVCNAVLDVCRYHRREMPYNNSDSKYEDPFVGSYAPLATKIDDYKSIGIDIMKVVAMLRIIDSCDVQSSRPGTEKEVHIALHLMKQDYETALIRSSYAYESYQQICDLIKTDNEFKKGCFYISCSYDQKTGLKMGLKDGYVEFKKSCIEALNSGNNESKTLARAWLTAADLIDRADMKIKQEKHYDKHMNLKDIKVIPALNFTKENMTIDIILCPRKILESTTSNDLLKEFTSEYEPVKQHLGKFNITIQYRWGDIDKYSEVDE
ncbi:MAG: hypothetical protein HQK96_09415 [Nitrospirae bacterium]|nr:hypothetical protein [Nitrospirota bacterium]